MAKKSTKKKEKEKMPEENFDESVQADIDTDFNLDDDYKPEPLIKNGKYKGNITGVALDLEKGSVDWTVVLDGNGGFMSDGETEIDGSEHKFSNWLPKASDKDEKTKSGRNKWQVKVNMLKRFADNMQIDMNSMDQIQFAIEDQEWVGLPVTCDMKIETYQGVHRSRINDMTLRSEG
jgi:hypothetical protein